MFKNGKIGWARAKQTITIWGPGDSVREGMSKVNRNTGDMVFNKERERERDLGYVDITIIVDEGREFKVKLI